MSNAAGFVAQFFPIFLLGALLGKVMEASGSHATGDDLRRHDGLSILLLYRIWSLTRAQPRAALSDLNGHTMRVAARALHARIAARSGLMPTMFNTRVRL